MTRSLLLACCLVAWGCAGPRAPLAPPPQPATPSAHSWTSRVWTPQEFYRPWTFLTFAPKVSKVVSVEILLDPEIPLPLQLDYESSRDIFIIGGETQIDSFGALLPHPWVRLTSATTLPTRLYGSSRGPYHLAHVVAKQIRILEGGGSVMVSQMRYRATPHSCTDYLYTVTISAQRRVDTLSFTHRPRSSFLPDGSLIVFPVQGHATVSTFIDGQTTETPMPNHPIVVTPGEEIRPWLAHDTYQIEVLSQERIWGLSIEKRHLLVTGFGREGHVFFSKEFAPTTVVFGLFPFGSGICLAAQTRVPKRRSTLSLTCYRDDGHIQWKMPLQSALSSILVVLDGSAFVGSSEGISHYDNQGHRSQISPERVASGFVATTAGDLCFVAEDPPRLVCLRGEVPSAV